MNGQRNNPKYEVLKVKHILTSNTYPMDNVLLFIIAPTEFFSFNPEVP